MNEKYIDSLIEEIKNINTDESHFQSVISSDDRITETKVIESQKMYFWIRLFINEECSDIELGDDITISWTPTGEELITKFTAYGKTGLSKDNGGIINYNSEDDNRVLCLMIDSEKINFNDEIPFIRTLFKTGYHFEYQLVKRSELLFTNNRTNEVLSYYDVDL